MGRSAATLAALFRSEQQLRILSSLFTDADEELSIGVLAERTGVAQATASREVARLAAHGLVVTRTLGRNTLVAANWSIPWARDLRSMLLLTVGVLGRLGDVLADVNGVEEAFVYGAWAARYFGAPDRKPREIDVVLVGAVSLFTARRVFREQREELRVDVEPVVVDQLRWTAPRPDDFVVHIRRQPRVPIPLEFEM